MKLYVQDVSPLVQDEFYFEWCIGFVPLPISNSFRNKKFYPDRCLAVGNQLLMYYGLSKAKSYTSLSQLVHSIVVGASGKPSCGDVCFNMSNDRESMWNSMAISDGTHVGARVGLDLINFKILSPNFVDELNCGVLHSSESAVLAQYHGDDRLRVFARLWSLKEAYGKYLGTGITQVDLKNLEFRHFVAGEGSSGENAAIELYIAGVWQPVRISSGTVGKDVYYAVVCDAAVDEPLEVCFVDVRTVVSVLEALRN